MTTMSKMDIGKRICSMLGINDNLVHSIQINIRTDDIVTVTIERYLHEDEAESVVETFSAMEWRRE